MTSLHGPSPLPESSFRFYGELARHWKWMAGLGALAIVLGLIGLMVTVTLTLASVLFFGALLILGGIFQALHTAKCDGWRSKALHATIALLYVAAGAVVLIDPVFSSAFLTLLLAAAVFLVGALRFAMGLQMRGRPGWGWPVFGGILAMLLGILIFAQWPSSALWVIGVFISVELLVHGWSMIAVSLAAREAHRSADEGA
ncbi:MAG TPA: HdeD family acid-resistance protein [Candidatus Krumholzibacteria bacterium]|nr:HdeD family acid-resistance protein [Candidatus Krumholzibacteria bacterium]